MIAYRIEHEKSELGPYQHWSDNKFLRNMVEDHNYLSTNTHPDPISDICRYPKLGDIFGFSSLKQLMLWFNSIERKQLKKLGFQIKVLKVNKNDVWFGKHQIMFPKSKATKINTIPLSKLKGK